MSKANTIICFGEALIDFLASPPTAGEARIFRQFAGGAPANAAVAVAKLGGRCEFVGMLGQDMFGDFLLKSLHEAGAGVRYVRRTASAKTALAFVSLDAHGERSFGFYRPPSADLLFRNADFDTACFAEAGVFHVCSNSLTDEDIATTTLSGMALARAGGALVSLDLNLRPALWPDATPSLPILWQALEAADLVKLAREELEYLKQGRHGDDEIVTRLLRTARLVLVTDGAAPMRWHTRERSGELAAFRVKAVRCRSRPAMPSTPIRPSTGRPTVRPGRRRSASTPPRRSCACAPIAPATAARPGSSTTPSPARRRRRTSR